MVEPLTVVFMRIELIVEESMSQQHFDHHRLPQTHPSRQRHTRIKVLATKALESLDTKLQPGIDQLAMRSFPQSVIHDGLVLVDGDGTGRVDNVTAGGGVGVDRVECAQDELFLQVGEEMEVSVGLATKDGSIPQSH
jgi:hypothetical protein